MADSTINLEEGDERREAEASERQERRRRRKSSTSEETTSERRPRDPENLRSRLKQAFDKTAEQLEIRGDQELSGAIRDEASAMAAGFDSLTHTLKPLRLPLLILVALIEPILAFWRVGGILFRRFMERRQRRYEQAMAEQEGVAVEYTPEMVP